MSHLINHSPFQLDTNSVVDWEPAEKIMNGTKR